jgi:hypothetical protein
MFKNMPKVQVQPRGTDEEQKLFSEVNNHYIMSKLDLDQRIKRKNGFDDMDKLFASYIDPATWPYRSVLFDATPFATIIEKDARLLGGKLAGRLTPREDGDALGAEINNEILRYQRDEMSKIGPSTIERWHMASQNARKYGSAFLLKKWRYETRVDRDTKKRTVFYDCPETIVCNPRDVLVNPSYPYINKWWQYREYNTLEELNNVNDVARTKPIYKNLDILQSALKEDNKSKSSDKRERNYVSKNKQIKGLTDTLGSDEVYKVVELITEYRPDRWITFAPRYGVVIRDIPNPYKHQEIPVIHLKYYSLPDDIYGIPELEPAVSQIKGTNAHLSAYSDTVATLTKPPIMVNPINVRMHTLEMIPEAKWLMNNPGADVIPYKGDSSITNNFQSVYTIMKSSTLNTLGEASQGISNIDPLQQNKTATEVKDTSFTRNVRDNMNLIFLSEALKKDVMFSLSMNKQFLFAGNAGKVKIIRIVGKDAVEYFNRQGLSDIRPTHQDAQDVLMGKMNQSDIIPGPRYGVKTPDGVVPKFQPDETGQGGSLYIEQGDLSGEYDYIPDVESMQAPSQQAVEQKLTAILGVLTNPVVLQELQMENKRPKISQLLIKMFESTNVIKDAAQYFEDIPQQPAMPGMMPGQPNDVQNQAQPGGAPTANAGGTPQGNVVPGGMANLTQMAGI